MRHILLATVLTLMALVAGGNAHAQPAAPILGEPEDGSSRWIYGGLSWFSVDVANGYRVQVDTLGGGFDGPLIVNDTVAAPGPDVTEIWHYNSVPPGLYEWRVAALAGDEQGAWSDVWSFESRFPVAAEDGPSGAGSPSLTVYPNPALVSAAFNIELPAAGPLRLSVYDARGREVAVVLDGWAEAGEVQARWQPGGLAAGVYLVRLTTGDASVSKPVILGR